MQGRDSAEMGAMNARQSRDENKVAQDENQKQRADDKDLGVATKEAVRAFWSAGLFRMTAQF